VLRTMFRNRQQVAGVVVDVVVVFSSLVIATYLRYDLVLPPGADLTLTVALPVVVGVKLLTLFASGMYRRMWRYTGSREIVAVVRASTVASLLSIVALVFFYRFHDFSRTLFVIDWIITTAALVGARGALRGLRGYFASHRRVGKRALLYGAGEGGSLAVRELSANESYRLVPVGFLDDDPSKQRMHLQGIPVVGAAEDIPELRRRLEVELVIVTARGLPDDRLESLQRVCEAEGMAVLEMNVSFLPLRELASRPVLVRSGPVAAASGSGH
jgi:UDP-GlcNAc:undecaprenyl-phosphate/decaprenyl-phosphate GlcNAc-1-phosphate transferase